MANSKARWTVQVTISVDAGTAQALTDLAAANANGNRSALLRHLIAVANLRPEIMGLRPAVRASDDAQKAAGD